MHQPSPPSLKRVIILTCLIFVVISCKKTSSNHEPSVSFKANGTEYIYAGSADNFIVGHGSEGWSLFCSLKATMTGYPVFYILFSTDSTLQLKTYYCPSNADSVGGFFRLSDTTMYTSGYFINAPTIFMSLTLTKIGDSTASGYFGAGLSPNMTISDGQFNNIQMVNF
jgi:hypothetical protein